MSPIYMPGRLRTASSPRSTLIECAPYSSGSMLGTGSAIRSLHPSTGDRRVGDREKLGMARQPGEKCRLGAGEPGLRAERDQAPRRAPRAGCASRCAATSSSSRIGGAPEARALSRACASRMAMSSAFCSPVEHAAAAMPLATWATVRSARCGPASVVPLSASARRPVARRRRSSSSAASAGMAASQPSTSPVSARRACGNGPSAAAHSPSSRAAMSRRAAAIAMPSAAIVSSSASSQAASAGPSRNSRARSRIARS